MAIKYENFASDTLMSFGKSFSRLNGQPLDKSSIWYSLSDAKAYAATGAAYIGQQLAVINTVGGGDEATTTVDCYVIKDEAGNLTQLSASEIGEELAGAIADLGERLDNLQLYTLDKYDSKSNTVEITPASLDEDGEIVRGNIDIKLGTDYVSGNLLKDSLDLGGDVGVVKRGLYVDPKDVKGLAKEQIIESLSDESPINGAFGEDGAFKFELRTNTSPDSYLDIDESYKLKVPRPPIVEDVQSTIKGQKAIEVTKTDILAILDGGPEEGINELHIGLNIKDGETVLKQDDNGLFTDLSDYAFKTDLDSKADKSVVDTLSETVNTNYQNLSGLISAEAETARAAEQANAKAASDAQATANDAKGKIDAFLDAENIGDATIDTLKEIQEYITTDGEAADLMVKDIAANKAAIEAEVERATGIETGLDNRLTEVENDIDDLETKIQEEGLFYIGEYEEPPLTGKWGDVIRLTKDYTPDSRVNLTLYSYSAGTLYRFNGYDQYYNASWVPFASYKNNIISFNTVFDSETHLYTSTIQGQIPEFGPKNTVINSGKVMGAATFAETPNANTVATEAAVVSYVDTQISTQVSEALTWGTI